MAPGGDVLVRDRGGGGIGIGAGPSKGARWLLRWLLWQVVLLLLVALVLGYVYETARGLFLYNR